MRLTTEQVNRIVQEVLAGKPDSLGTPESKRMRAEIEKEVEAAKAAGQTIDLPNEVPDVSEDAD